MTRDIKVGDFVKVVSKIDPRNIWVEEMDRYVNDGIEYEVNEVLELWGGAVELNNTNYIFPLTSVELIEVAIETDIDPDLKCNFITPHQTTIQNCILNGVQWDEKAVETIQTVADALLMNATALNSLVDVFKSQNIQIDSMIKVGS